MLTRRKALRLLAVSFLALATVCSGLFTAPAMACTRLNGVRLNCSDGSKSSRGTAKKVSPRTALMRLLNDERSERGLGRLTLDERADQMAREHARRMARRQRLYHNPELKTAAGRKRLGWPSLLGENVGAGPSPSSIHQAFMKSDSHRANILRRGYRTIGLGVYDDGRTLWVVQVFLTRRHRVANSYPAATAGPDRAEPKHAATSAKGPRQTGRPTLIGSWGASVPRAFVDPAPSSANPGHRDPARNGAIVVLLMLVPAAFLITRLRARALPQPTSPQTTRTSA